MIIFSLFSYFVFAAIASFYSLGTLIAYHQNEYPSIAKESYRTDLGMSVIFALCCFIIPFFAIIAFCTTGFNKHGWQIMPNKNFK